MEKTSPPASHHRNLQNRNLALVSPPRSIIGHHLSGSAMMARNRETTVSKMVGGARKKLRDDFGQHVCCFFYIIRYLLRKSFRSMFTHVACFLKNYEKYISASPCSGLLSIMDRPRVGRKYCKGHASSHWSLCGPPPVLLVSRKYLYFSEKWSIWNRSALLSVIGSFETESTENLVIEIFLQ